MPNKELINKLAKLAVRVGANVQKRSSRFY